MATGIVSVPKPKDSAGLPKMNLPNIQHPLTRMGSVDQLTVRGDAGGSALLRLSQRTKSLLSFSTEKSMLPPLSDRPHGSSAVEHTYPADIYGTKIPGDKGKFRNSVEFHPKYTMEELLILLQDRLVTGTHGVRCMFKNHDPNGQGQVTREALKRIFYSLVGYISNDMYHRVIKILGLDNRNCISFEDFVLCFKDSEAVKKEWMNTVQKASLQSTHAEEHLRNASLNFKGDTCTAASVLSILRDRFRKSKGVKVVDILPQSCAEVGGRVVPGHLSDLLCSMDISMTEREFNKLWARFDTENYQSVKTVHFLKVLGLDEEGQPRPHTTPRYVLVSKNTDKVVAVRGAGAGDDKPQIDRPAILPPIQDKPAADAVAVAGKGQESSKKPAQPRKVIVNKGNRVTPRLERALDCLYFKFEDNYNALRAGLQLFDFVEDGHIAKIDLRQVLCEFGLKVQALDFEQFLSKCGIRTVNGQIDWKEFLAKFWNKSDSGIVHRIVTSRHHVYFKGVSGSLEHYNAEELEAKLVDFFHKDFLHLLAALKKCDKYQIGVVTQYEFRDCVERCLGYSLNEAQFDQLKQDVGLDPDGLVPYAKFMEKFSAEPGLWNKRLEGEFSVRKVSVNTTNTMAPALDRLKVYSDKSKEEQQRIITAEREKKTNLDIMKERIRSHESTQIESPAVVKDPQEKVVTPEDKKKEEEVQKLMSTMIDKPLVNRSREGPDPHPPQAMMPEDHLGNLLQRGPDRMDRHESGKVHPVVDHSQEARSLTELHNILHILFKQRFHSVDKAFKQLDRKMTGRFNKHQFMEFLKECEVYFTTTEVNNLWNTFETSVDGMYNFSTLVRHVTEYNPRPPTIKGKLPIHESKMDIDTARQKMKEQRQTPRRDVSRMGVVPLMRERSKIDVRERDGLLDKVRPHVVSNWEILKTSFRQLDKHGRAVISLDDMRDISRNLKFDLTAEETEKLFQRFDFLNNGNFHYIEFLKMYTERVQAERPMPANTTYSKLSYKLEKRLLQDWKSVKRAFKKFDTEGKGFLTSVEFKTVLKSCGIQITEEDMYHVMTEFDTQLEGRVSYEDFLNQLLSTV